jgi:hypothetical protein
VLENSRFVSGHRFSDAVSSSKSEAPLGAGHRKPSFSALYKSRRNSAWIAAVNAKIKCSIEPSPVPHPLLFLISTSLTVELSMKNRTETLEIGSRAPDFSLGAANREGTFTLRGLLDKGALILEFLRGTW